MALSYTEFGTKSPGDTIIVSFPIRDRGEVYVVVGTTTVSPALYSWVNDGLISCGPGFPPGAGRVERRTPVNAYDHTQSGSSVYDWRGVNENFEQNIFILQEYADGEAERDAKVEFAIGGGELAAEKAAEAAASAALAGIAATGAQEAADGAVSAVAGLTASLTSHTSSSSNPHGTTKAQVGLGNVDNVPAASLRDRSTHTGSQSISTVLNLQSSLDAKLNASEKGQVNGLAPLDSTGKVDQSFLPALAITDVFTVNTQSSMLALSAQRGDVAVRSDLDKTFILQSEPASTLANWVELKGPTAAVSSVAGKTGVVTLSISDIGSLQTSLDAKQAAIGYTAANKAGDTFTGWVRNDAGVFWAKGTLGNAPQFRLGGTSGWRPVKTGADNEVGDLVFQTTTDDYSTVTDRVRFKSDGSVDLGGKLTAQGLTYGSSIGISSQNIDNLFVAGFYSGSSLAGTLPFTSTAGFRLQVDTSANDTNYCRQRICFAESKVAAEWVRSRSGGSWGEWIPVGLEVTPRHFGATSVFHSGWDCQQAGINEAAAISRWLASPWPKYLDGYYLVDNTTITVTRPSSARGYTIRGGGAQTGLILKNFAPITLQGMDHDNPSGATAETVTLRDFQILLWQQGDFTQDHLTISCADGDAGSAMPGIHMENVHFLSVMTGFGTSGAILRLHNIRQGHLSNVSGMGKYFGYRGYGIRYTQGANGTTVEMSHYNVRMSHVAKAFAVEAAGGAVANDDSQGYHWTNCVALAVDRGWEVSGGSEGFGEWFTLTSCHAYFREIGVYGVNAGNWRMSGYLLGHGALSESQAVVLSGSSIVGANMLGGIIVNFGTSTATTRRGFNLAGTLSGSLSHCRVIGATHPYTNVAGSWVQTDNS